MYVRGEGLCSNLGIAGSIKARMEQEQKMEVVVLG